MNEVTGKRVKANGMHYEVIDEVVSLIRFTPPLALVTASALVTAGLGAVAAEAASAAGRARRWRRERRELERELAEIAGGKSEPGPIRVFAPDERRDT
jgi:hypothetical protein